MPSEHLPPPAQLAQDSPQQQIKVCSSCLRPLSSDAPSSPFRLHDANDASETSSVCGPCRIRLVTRRIESSLPTARGGTLFARVERELLRRSASLQAGILEDDTSHSPLATLTTLTTSPPSDQQPAPRCTDGDVDMNSPDEPAAPLTVITTALAAPRHPLPASDSPPRITVPATSYKPQNITDATAPQPQTPVYSHAAHSPVASSPWASSSKSQLYHYPSSYADPLADITRLRVRSQGHHCLYPGASFQGTQKSGRNSYDVNVTIVDVDFSSSHLCGYLRIRGLTDDWPELTTYFDAEIIGSRYGFLTRNWGATEQEDMVHWARFPAFRHVRHELKKPHLTMKDADRGAVFMRWKEKFLVPDHRVQDISGASFAGFYYVCVDFNPQHTAAQQPSLPTATEDELEDSPEHIAVAKPDPEPAPRPRRESMDRGARRGGRSSSRGVREPSNVATMSGFYFHQNSEPYQQLSLVHVPEHTSTCFEFR